MSEITKRPYNGWNNYATWRINLEIFDGIQEDWDAEKCKDYVEEILEQSPKLALDYARAFLRQVDYREIAEHINED